MQNPRLKSGLVIRLGVIFAVLALCLIGLRHATPPSSLPSSVSATVFSSERAMRYLSAIAQQPHPTGTVENAKVHDYLIAELKALGLAPLIQTDLAIHHRGQHRIAGVVHNVLVRIPGKISGKALLVAAHYDSTHTGPGAADDGASVAAILETLRALKNLSSLQNDLICIFTDGEEAGLLGAEAFVSDHPWAKAVGLALNFEYRGNRGPLVMFETSPGNGKLIDGLANAPHPFGNSLMYEVYKRLPNDTDLSVFKRAGIAGMNFAAIEGHTSYHTQLDRPELMQEASLQHEGETMLSLVQYFGNTDLTPLQSADKVYFDAPGLGMISYPVSWAQPLSGVLIMLFGALGMLGMKRGELRPARTILGIPAFLFVVLLLAGSCQLLWALIQYLHPQYQLLLQGDTYNSHWYLLAFVLLVIAGFSAVQSSIQTWISPMEMTVSAIAGWLIILVAASVWMPGASFLLFWPLAPVLLVTALLFGLRDINSSSPIRVLIIIFGAAPGILLFAPFIKALFIGLTPNQIGLVMGFLAFLLGLLTPLLDLFLRSFKLPLTLLISGLSFLIIGSWTSGFDTKHPQPNNLFYALDSLSGKAFWLSTDKSLDSWTRTFFNNAKQKRRVPEIFGEKPMTYWAEPAPLLAFKAPVITVLEDKVHAGMRTITIQVRSLRQAPELDVYMEGIDVIGSKVENRIFSQSLEPKWSFQGLGFSDKGVRIELNIKAGKPFKIRVIDFSYELPKTGFLPRPPDMITQPFGLSDTTAVVNMISVQ